MHSWNQSRPTMHGRGGSMLHALASTPLTYFPQKNDSMSFRSILFVVDTVRNCLAVAHLLLLVLLWRSPLRPNLDLVEVVGVVVPVGTHGLVEHPIHARDDAQASFHDGCVEDCENEYENVPWFRWNNNE